MLVGAREHDLPVGHIASDRGRGTGRGDPRRPRLTGGRRTSGLALELFDDGGVLQGRDVALDRLVL
ncbi:MAG: hypothetical protein WD382_04035, partial [Halofilum sp. (in: g-proteobacteria)]